MTMREKYKKYYGLSKQFFLPIDYRTIYCRVRSKPFVGTVSLILLPFKYLSFLFRRCVKKVNERRVKYGFKRYAKNNQSKLISDLIKPIALYLPQFHQIPENDEWWGKGFTEWTNVKKAVPLFDGHYQPHVPHKDIGYYDLSDVNVMRKQAKMARKYGIYGFCFYYYHFVDGKRLLEKPINNWLKTKDIDFPFCFAWANENWTRNWDGGNKEVIMPQDYSDQNMIKMLNDMMEAFKDERYIKIDGRPVLLVYRAEIIPEIKRITNEWRDVARNNGFDDLYLISMQNFEEKNPIKMGFDAAVEFAPQTALKVKRDVRIVEKVKFDEMMDYKIYFNSMERVIDNMSYRCRVSYPRIKCVCPSWDNSPRRGVNGSGIFLDASVDRFKEFIKKSVKESVANDLPASGLLFVNAWNEWGEGAHLEPDEKYGYEWLKAVKSVLDQRVEEL